MASVNNTLVGVVRAEATLESGKFVDGAKKIRLETQKTETAVKRGFSGMGTAIKGFGGAVTAGLSIGLLTGLATKAIQYAKSIGTVAKQLGVTTTELQEFRYAAMQVGATVPEADKALERLGVSMSNALAGSKEAQKAFASVGVTLADLKTKSQTEIFGQIADQMNRQGGAAKNAAAGTRLMGEGFSKLAPLLDQGSAGINNLRDAVHRLGGVLSEDQIQRADDTARKLNDVKMVLAAQISGVVADNAQSIVTLANALASLTSSIVNFLGSNPQAAIGLLGALAGSRFGLPGAAAGGIGGLFVGGRMAKTARDSNTDIRFRMEQTRKAKADFEAAQKNFRPHDGNYKQAEKDLRKQTKLLREATSAYQASRSGGGRPALPVPEFLASGGSKGRKARTPRAPRDRSEDVAFQFERELRLAQMDVLRAQQGLADHYVDRRNIGIEILELQREEHEAELQNRVRLAERDAAEGKITRGTLEQVKVQADQLRLEYDKKHALEVQALNEEEQARAREEIARYAEIDYEIQREKLELEGQLAETAAEQRDVALRALDLWYQYEKAKLNTIMAENAVGSAAWEEARRRKVALEQGQGARQQTVLQGTRGPLEDYMSRLPDTTEKWNEALENVAVNGLQAVEDGLVSILTGTKSVGEALHDMLGQIIQDLIRLGIQRAISMAISGGGLGFATGGYVSGPGTATSDSIPAMLSNGEYVVNSKAVGSFGVPFFNAINTGQITPQMLGGGKGGGLLGDAAGMGMFGAVGMVASGNKFPIFGLLGKVLGFSGGGLAGGVPIPRTSMGARANVSNDNRAMRGGDTFHFSFPGVTNAKEARTSGLQAANAFRSAIGRSARVNG